MTKWSYVARKNTHIERACQARDVWEWTIITEVTSLYICVSLQNGLQFPVPETLSALLLCRSRPDFPWAETSSGRWMSYHRSCHHETEKRSEASEARCRPPCESWGDKVPAVTSVVLIPPPRLMRLVLPVGWVGRCTKVRAWTNGRSIGSGGFEEMIGRSYRVSCHTFPPTCSSGSARWGKNAIVQELDEDQLLVDDVRFDPFPLRYESVSPSADTSRLHTMTRRRSLLDEAVNSPILCSYREGRLAGDRHVTESRCRTRLRVSCHLPVALLFH